MGRWSCVIGIVVASLASGCASSVNVEQEQTALLALDGEWSQSAKELDKFLSYFAADASVYAPGMPITTGSAAIRAAFVQMLGMPGFSIAWTPAKAHVTTSGDLGYTAGSYKMTAAGTAENGKYLTVWKKQPGGAWKVAEDIFNADAMPQAPAAQHTVVAPATIKWGDAPPSLPPGSKMAVISGDPTKAGPFVVRAQFPAGYRVAPHWHPGVENVTVLAGTLSLGMGDTFDATSMTNLASGGYAALPPGMRHYVITKTGTTIQIDGNGPLVINYVNPADDPSKAQQ